MRKLLFLVFILTISFAVKAQSAWDSISISRFYIKEEMYGASWRDTLKLGRFPAHVYEERTTWTKPAKPSKILPPVIALSNRIKANGTEDVAKCFIPRHSINYYKGGKIARYLLICFECDGMRFSDDPKNSFIKSVPVREKQMAELKTLFTDML